MSSTATALKPVHHPMEITIYQENGKFGYLFGNGPCIHSKGGFSSVGAAESAGRQDRAETITYAHRFEPRAQVMFDPKDGRRYVTGWIYKCACGQVRNPNNERGNTIRITNDGGPCGAVIKARVA